MSRTTAVVAGLLLASGLSTGCTELEESLQEQRSVLVVGIDVSGSFRNSERYQDAVDFLAHYLYGHLEGLGDLEPTTALFVGSVGGDIPGETKAFHPIHDFEGKSVEQIAEDLDRWFPAEDRLTDFNAFFERTAELIQRQGLVLAPINVVVLSDGVPDLAASSGPSTRQARVSDEEGAGGPPDPYLSIDLSPLEYLSRSVTVRLLYPDPSVAADWERRVERRRVRIWTTNAQVMEGWSNQLQPGTPPEAQARLWTWTADNVDFRVRSRIF